MEKFEVKYKTDYGASELKKLYQKYLTIALVIGMAFHFLGVGAYWGVVYATTEDGPSGTVRLIVKYSDLGPPPSLTQAMAAAVTAANAGVKPSVGIPVPVPDAEVSPEQTIATQTEMSQQVAPIDQGPGGGEKEIKIEEDEAPPADYVPYEKAPEAVKQVQPKYPDLATRAGLEGTVWVKIWVDKEKAEEGRCSEERRRNLQSAGNGSRHAVGLHARHDEERTGVGVGFHSVSVQAAREVSPAKNRWCGVRTGAAWLAKVANGC